MKSNIFLIFSAMLAMLSCQNKIQSKRIDVKYINYTLESVSGPKWEEVINGEHSTFLVKSSIVDEIVCDSIISIVIKLKPMKKETIPTENYPYMHCTIHYSANDSSILILGHWYSTLDGVAIVSNDSLVKLLRKYSGYNHPPL